MPFTDGMIIDRAHYDQLRAENERLKDQRASSGYEADELDRLRTENERLRTALSACLDVADGKYSGPGWKAIDMAREALNETKTEQAQMAPSKTGG